MMEGAIDHTVPLTFGQRALLLTRCLPLLFFSIATAAYLTILRTVYPFKTGLVVFLAIVILVTGYSALQSVRDLARGSALVTEDLLQNVIGRGSQRRRRRHHRGDFARLGRLTLTSASFHQAQRGRRHRLTYSPASKIVWSLEPLP
jgi:hypothetical protein